MKKLRLKRILVIFFVILVWYGINFYVAASNGYEVGFEVYEGSKAPSALPVVIFILKNIIVVWSIILGLLSIEKIVYIVNWLKNKESVNIKLDRKSFWTDCFVIIVYTVINFVIYKSLSSEWEINPYIQMMMLNLLFGIPIGLCISFGYKLDYYSLKKKIKKQYKNSKNNKEWLNDEKWMDYDKKHKRLSKIIFFMLLITLLLLIRFLHLLS